MSFRPQLQIIVAIQTCNVGLKIQIHTLEEIQGLNKTMNSWILENIRIVPYWQSNMDEILTHQIILFN